MNISIPANKKIFDKYLFELADKQAFWKRKKIKIEKKLFELFSKERSFDFTSFEDFINWETGASYIRDEEVIYLRRFRPLHPILSVFDADVGRSTRKYTLNLNNGVLLRGVVNYYFGAAYWNQKQNNSVEYIDDIFNRVVFFINKCLKYMERNVLDVDDKYDFLFLYAFGDVCFNLLIHKLYANLKAKTNNTDFVITGCNVSSIEKKLINAARTLAGLQYDLIFSPKNYSQNLIKIQAKEIISFIKKYKTSPEGLPEGALRLWRETDNFIENASIFYSLKEEFSFGEYVENVIFFGLNYGSFHLAIQASSLFRSLSGIETEVGFVFTQKTYHELYKDRKTIASKFSQEKSKIINVIIDDNIVSGKSLEEGIAVLGSAGYVPYKAIIMRHPSIKRVYQMYYSQNQSCVNLDLFDSFLIGTFYPTDFTKIINKEYADGYVDKLGVFDSARQFIFERIYCNESYGEDSIIKYTFDGV